MDRLEIGNKLMKEVLSEESVIKLQEHLESIYPPFSNFLKSTFGDLYSDDTLDLKTKEMIVLVTLITQKDTKPQLRTHLKAALKAGMTQKEILAMILHLVAYIGFPSTINALNTAKEVFDEVGLN